MKYLIAILLAPLLFFYTLFHFMGARENLDLLSEKIERLHIKALQIRSQKEKEELFLTSLKQADRFFIDKELETLPYHLLFSESEIRRSATLKETEEKQKSPVEINEVQLCQLLNLLEGQDIKGRPQLLIKQFDISKKLLSSKEKTYVINMQLIKRELNQ